MIRDQSNTLFIKINCVKMVNTFVDAVLSCLGLSTAPKYSDNCQWSVENPENNQVELTSDNLDFLIFEYLIIDLSYPIKQFGITLVINWISVW